MNSYPRLSDSAYKDDAQHRTAILQVMTEEVCRIWRWYNNRRLTEAETQNIRDSLQNGIPSYKNFFQIGDKVVIKVIPELVSDDWSSIVSRINSGDGTVTAVHGSHGLCYTVQHADGSVGHYEPWELSLEETDVKDKGGP